MTSATAGPSPDRNNRISSTSAFCLRCIVPAWAVAGGVAATVAIGGLAGLYPAIRAYRLSPTEALATP
ncbi:hypothetical protein GCM10023194_31130 [Planotetraspora phitsanulokensis]|uniref:Uncharacterized protein n=1 Tax=Planotetraspora phitsanulokensis TaxID=575192 RepID=A0A8J3XCT5_9ACTN|nr:hypothetical protein [Planotetraspora phitsanulokensis]GII35749.1 hypothetical protein Pph01_07520 [Planotetraspora phitsanulokensis]